MTELIHGQPTFPRLFTFRSDSDETLERRWPNLPRFTLGWQLGVLFLLCLVPRAWMAYLTQTICHDGFYYISTASAFEHGDWARAFAYLNLNIYPLILLGLHSLGLEWILAGKLWSVLISSLAVLPLFGWIRRLFSDQVAWASCFLYSLHAEFVERSFEPTRDPTFWFLFNLCLYTTLRAVSEAKPRWFLANGLVLTLAIHTRSEGWLLLIPLGLWLAREWFVKAECRKRLLAGTVVCLSVLPCVILLVNLTILREEPEWHLGR
ncbi:MAG: glycosyltransferase family 39 protein, partial [Planctomycetaceae bacterium]|nr:glycosyltransferase family 39 protein [Planctomycetaceae bacterium]